MLSDQKLLSMLIIFTSVNSMISIMSKPILFFFTWNLLFSWEQKGLWSVDQMNSLRIELLANLLKVKFHKGC